MKNPLFQPDFRINNRILPGPGSCTARSGGDISQSGLFLKIECTMFLTTTQKPGIAEKNGLEEKRGNLLSWFSHYWRLF